MSFLDIRLMAASLLMASPLVGKLSHQTSSTGRRLLVYLAPRPDWWAAIRFSRQFVHPV